MCIYWQASGAHSFVYASSVANPLPQYAHLTNVLDCFVVCIGGLWTSGAVPSGPCKRTCGNVATVAPFWKGWGFADSTMRFHAHGLCAIAFHTDLGRPANTFFVGNQYAPHFVILVRAVTVAYLNLVLSGPNVVPGRQGPATAVHSAPWCLTWVSHSSARFSGACTIFGRLLSRCTMYADEFLTFSAVSGSCLLHLLGVCGGPPMQPLEHDSKQVPNVCTTTAAAGARLGALQQNACLHLPHLSAPHAVHVVAVPASVARADLCGSHAHAMSNLVDDVELLPPDSVAWIFFELLPSEAGAALPPSDFLEKCCLWFERSFMQLRVTSVEYVSDLFLVYGRLCSARNGGLVGGNGSASLIPAFTVGERSPPLLSDLSPVATLCARGGDISAECSLLLYQFTLRAFCSLPEPVNVDFSVVDSSGFEYLFNVLLGFSDDCLFPVTGDLYLHVVIGFFIPSWRGMMYSTVGYPLLSTLYGAAANTVARPYMDTPITTLLRDRAGCFDDDNVILFVLVTTLIAELVADKRLSLVRNRHILTRPPGNPVPQPFVLCDFAVPSFCGSDAYGYVDSSNRLHVCNGHGVSKAVSSWLGACYEVGAALVIKEFLTGAAGPTNPLVKYASVARQPVSEV